MVYLVNQSFVSFSYPKKGISSLFFKDSIPVLPILSSINLANQKAFAFQIPKPVFYSNAKINFKLRGRDSLLIKSDQGEINSIVEYTSKDSTAFDISGRKVYLYNDAVVKYDDIVLKAGYVEMDQGNFTLYAKGILDTAKKYVQKPEVTQGTSKINADSLRYNFKTKKTVAWQGVSSEGGGYFIGEKVKLDEKKQGFLRNGIYTTCQNFDHPHYGILISRAKITENTIITGPVHLFVEDVPIPIFLPFGFFPKTDKQADGIIFPSVGEDQTLGFFLRDFGYYQGFGDHFDAQIKASIYSEGSFGFSIDSRYNYIYKSTGNFSFRYFDQKIGNKGTSDFQDSKDFNISWTHSQSEKAHPGTTFSASVNAASTSYFQNSTTSYLPSVRAQNAVGSSINLAKIWDGSPWSLNVGLTHSQNLAQKQITITFPSLSVALTRINPFDSKNRVGPQKWYQKIGFSYTLQAQNQLNNIYTPSLFTDSTLKKLQNGILHSPSISLGTYNIFKYLLVNPNITYTERWYFQTYRQHYDFTKGGFDRDTIQGFRTERDFSFSIGTDTHIYGMLKFSKGSIKAIRHVLEPQISFSYTPDFSKISPNSYGKYHNYSTGNDVTYSIFDGGLYGAGPVGVSKSININLNNTLEMKVKSKKDTVNGESKVPIFESFNITASYNLAADSFRLSNIGISGATTLFKKLGVNFSGTLDPYSYDAYGNRTKAYLFTTKHQLARLTNFNLSFNLSLNSNSKTASTQNPQKKSQGFNINPNANDYVDFKIPWDIRLNYNFSYSLSPGSSALGTSKTITRTNVMNMSGNLTVTPHWKVGYTSGLDFENKVLTATQFSIFRDLHCWQLSMSWSPFGAVKFYSVELRVASGILQDLKIDKRKDYYNTY